MPDVTFEYNGAKITVRETTGRDELLQDWVKGELINAIAEKQKKSPQLLDTFVYCEASDFAYVLMRSTVTGKLGYTWPKWRDASREELYAVYTRFMENPRELMRLWLNALKKTDREIPDPEG